MSELGDMTTASMGKQYFTLSYDCAQHNKRIGWLYKNAGITKEEEFLYEGDQISVKVLLDDVTYMRYLKEFEP